MYMTVSSVPACDSSFILTNFSPILDPIAIASFFVIAVTELSSMNP